MAASDALQKTLLHRGGEVGGLVLDDLVDNDSIQKSMIIISGSSVATNNGITDSTLGGRANKGAMHGRVGRVDLHLRVPRMQLPQNGFHDRLDLQMIEHDNNSFD